MYLHIINFYSSKNILLKPTLSFNNNIDVINIIKEFS